MVSTLLVALLPICAPLIDPDTALRLIEAESGGRQFAININGPFVLSRQPRSYAEFEQVVHQLESNGYNFDFGFSQANNREVRRRGYTVAQKIDPCSNLGFMQEVLSSCFHQVPKRITNSQDRLANALSCYNTGRYGPGFTNGYVNRVWYAVPKRAREARAVIPHTKVPVQLKERLS